MSAPPNLRQGRRLWSPAWHVRCLAAVASSYLFGNTAFLALVGFINRVLGSRIAGVFLLYPARREYADALAYRWHQHRFSWSPGLVGIYRQNKRLGLIFGIPDMEDDVRNPVHAGDVLSLLARMERIRRLIGAERKIFAGILPSTFSRLGAADAHLSEQRTLTAKAVISALDQIMASEGLAAQTPIFVLGGRGYIASEVIQLAQGRPLIAIDLDGMEFFLDVTRSMHGGPAILINITKSGALAEYAPHLWPGCVVLNEVYPEPGAEELDALAARGVRCFHVVGVPGRALPAFPRAYRGGIPCCASLPEKAATDVGALVTRLV